MAGRHLLWGRVADSIENAPERLREHMVTSGLSYRDVASEIGIAHSHLYGWLKGTRELTSSRLALVLRWMGDNRV